MADDYIPRPDARFPTWRNNFATDVNNYLADLGLAAGAMGAEIWVKVGDPQRGLALPPTGPSELSFLSVDTCTPHVVDCPGEDGGKAAHYMLRCVATTGEKGPWSETASATIGA